VRCAIAMEVAGPTRRRSQVEIQRDSRAIRCRLFARCECVSELNMLVERPVVSISHVPQRVYTHIFYVTLYSTFVVSYSIRSWIRNRKWQKQKGGTSDKETVFSQFVTRFREHRATIGRGSSARAAPRVKTRNRSLSSARFVRAASPDFLLLVIQAFPSNELDTS